MDFSHLSPRFSLSLLEEEEKNLQTGKKRAGVAFSMCLALSFRVIRQGRFTLHIRFLAYFLPHVQ